MTTFSEFPAPFDPDGFEQAVSDMAAKAQEADALKLAVMSHHLALLEAMTASGAELSFEEGMMLADISFLMARADRAGTDEERTAADRNTLLELVAVEAPQTIVGTFMAYRGLAPLTSEEVGEVGAIIAHNQANAAIDDLLQAELAHELAAFGLATEEVDDNLLGFATKLSEACYMLRYKTAPEDRALLRANTLDGIRAAMPLADIDPKFLDVALRMLNRELPE